MKFKYLLLITLACAYLFLDSCSSSKRADLNSLIQCRADERLFTIFAFASVGGFEFGEGHTISQEVQQDLKSLDPDLKNRIVQFCKKYPILGSGEVFCVVATRIGDAPDFKLSPELLKELSDFEVEYSEEVKRILIGAGIEFTVVSGNKIKGLFDFDGEEFVKLLKEFYRKGQIASLWQKCELYYDIEAKKYKLIAVEQIKKAVNYLRIPMEIPIGEIPIKGIVILPNLFYPSGTATNASDFAPGDTIFIVLGWENTGISHEFMHSIINPLVRTNFSLIEESRSIYKLIKNDPELDNIGYPLFDGFFMENLVRAIDLRLDGQDSAAVLSLYRQGFIYTLPFYEKLADFEKDTLSIVDYFPQLVKSIDVEKEIARWNKSEGSKF